MTKVQIGRWEIQNTFHEGKRKFFSAKCEVCGEFLERVRSDYIKKAACSCTRKQPGKPLNIGDVFGDLTVLEKAPSRGKSAFYTVQCSCGEVKDVDAGHLRNGSTKSCGCALETKRGSRRQEHGLSNSKEYKVWLGIVARTSHPYESTRKWYYDKGVKMSPEWRSSFSDFYEDMGPCPDGYSIDRVEPDGDYCKENCRWASPPLQAINKGLFSNNKSGKSGVSFNSQSQKWIAKIYVNNLDIYLGIFESFDDAVKAREDAELKYRSHIKE